MKLAQWALFAAGTSTIAWRLVFGWTRRYHLLSVAFAFLAIGVAGRLARGPVSAIGYGLLAVLLLTPAFAVVRAPGSDPLRTSGSSHNSSKARNIALLVIGISFVTATAIQMLAESELAKSIASGGLIFVVIGATGIAWLAGGRPRPDKDLAAKRRG